MKKVLIVALVVVGCQRHDDSTAPETIASATPSASPIASATPLAPIEPMMTASAAPTSVAIRDAGRIDDQTQRELDKKSEEILKALGALGGSPSSQGVLRRDLPSVDLSEIAARDAGMMQYGGGTGSVLRQGGAGGGGLSGLGARDH